MPIYQYKCDNCEHEFEEWNNMEEREQVECPECGEEAKLIPSGGHFSLVGNWHKNTGTY
jgi:putative FmdB family regulatory protein